MTDLSFDSAVDLVKAIKSRKIRSTELLEHNIERMERFNPKINAIVATDLDNARKRSREADEALERGEDWGVLHGLPMTIKDSYEVKGMPCTSGSPDLKNYQPAENAYVVQKLVDDQAYPTDVNVLDCLQKAVDELAKNGAHIEEKKPDIDFSRSHALFTQLLQAATSAGLPKKVFVRMLGEAANLSAEVHGDRDLTVKGITLLHRDWIRLNYARTMMRETWANFFKAYDILLCPTVSITAFPHDHNEDFFARKLEVNGEARSYFDTTIAWAGLTGMAYLPSTIAPVGPARDGLPVGLQIVAPYLEDRTSLHFAGLVEEVIGGFKPPSDFV